MPSIYPAQAERFARRAPVWPARGSSDMTMSTEEERPSAHHAAHRREEFFDEDTLLDDFRGKAKALSSPLKGRKYASSAHEHLSPAIAARHMHLRQATGLAADIERAPMRIPHSSDAEESESDNETSSTSSSASFMGATAPFHEAAESTGNHQGLISSPEARSARVSRPGLNIHALDELDRVAKRGTSLRQTRTQTTRDHGKQQHRSPFKPFAASGRKYAPQNADDPEVGTSRKVSSGSSSNGRKHPGTTGSTSGETLVEEEQRHYKKAGDILLPSGQRMGKGVWDKDFVLPDMTGMVSALESPVRERIGVRHTPINHEQMQELQVNLAQARTDQFDRLADNIKGVESNLAKTQEKIARVEASRYPEQTHQWQSARHNGHSDEEGRAKKTSHRFAGRHELQENATSCDRKMQQINRHVAQLDKDLKSYRKEMQGLVSPNLRRQESFPQPTKEHLRSQSSPRSVGRWSLEDEPSLEDYDILRDQVDTVAQEVERLKAIVRERDDAHNHKAASSPIKPSNGVKAFGLRNFGHSKPLPESKVAFAANKPAFKTRKNVTVKDAEDSDSERPQQGGKRRGVPHSDTEAYILHRRAESTINKLPLHYIQHDSATCSVCRGTSFSHDDKSTPKRTRSHAKRRTSLVHAGSAVTTEQEHAILDILLQRAPECQVRALAAIGFGHRALRQHAMERLLREHKDDFYHFRETYGDMADELKKVDINMHPIDRRILADGVIDMVETLEQCATRINALQRFLEASDASSDSDQEDEAVFASDPEGRRHSAHHRHACKTSHGHRRGY